MPYLEQIVQGVKAMGLETCMTLGMLNESRAQRLANAGPDYYNHNPIPRRSFTAISSLPVPIRSALDTPEKSPQKQDKSVPGRHYTGSGETVPPIAPWTVVAVGEPADAAGKARANQHAGEGKGTAACDNDDVDAFDFGRTIAVASAS